MTFEQLHALEHDSDDALDLAIGMNLDRVMAQHVDPVAYMELSACESLDDEIENFERFASNMPFGGEDQPIRGFQCWDPECYCQ